MRFSVLRLFKKTLIVGAQKFENDSFNSARLYMPNGSYICLLCEGICFWQFNNDDKVTSFPAETADNFEIGTKEAI